MSPDRRDLDWVTAMVSIGAAVAVGLIVPCAMDFGRDGGRWWLAVVVLVAASSAVYAAAFVVVRLRRAAEDADTQRPDGRL